MISSVMAHPLEAACARIWWLMQPGEVNSIAPALIVNAGLAQAAHVHQPLIFQPPPALHGCRHKGSAQCNKGIGSSGKPTQALLHSCIAITRMFGTAFGVLRLTSQAMPMLSCVHHTTVQRGFAITEALPADARPPWAMWAPLHQTCSGPCQHLCH